MNKQWRCIGVSHTSIAVGHFALFCTVEQHGRTLRIKRMQCNEKAATSRRVRKWKVTNDFVVLCPFERIKATPIWRFSWKFIFGISTKSVGVFRLRLSSDKKQTFCIKTYVPVWSIAMIGTPQVDEPAFRHVRKTAKMTISFVMSVRSQGTTWLPLDGFSLNLIFDLWKSVAKIEV